jgi:hypothetical protein
LKTSWRFAFGSHCFLSSRDAILGWHCTSMPSRPNHCSPQQRQHRFLIVSIGFLKGDNILQRCQSHLLFQHIKTITPTFALKLQTPVHRPSLTSNNQKTCSPASLSLPSWLGQQWQASSRARTPSRSNTPSSPASLRHQQSSHHTCLLPQQN